MRNYNRRSASVCGELSQPCGNAWLGRIKVLKAGICSAEYPIEEGVAAFEKGKRPNTLKVVIDIAGNGKAALVSN